MYTYMVSAADTQKRVSSTVIFIANSIGQVTLRSVPQSANYRRMSVLRIFFLVGRRYHRHRCGFAKGHFQRSVNWVRKCDVQVIVPVDGHRALKNGGSLRSTNQLCMPPFSVPPSMLQSQEMTFIADMRISVMVHKNRGTKVLPAPIHIGREFLYRLRKPLSTIEMGKFQGIKVVVADHRISARIKDKGSTHAARAREGV